MSDRYISKCELTFNGQSLTDFSAFSESERALAQQVNLMNKTGYADLTPRYQITLDYNVPASGDEFDWDGLRDATLVVEYDGGRRTQYSGVRTLSVGESALNGNDHLVRPVTLGAATRRVE